MLRYFAERFAIEGVTSEAVAEAVLVVSSVTVHASDPRPSASVSRSRATGSRDHAWCRIDGKLRSYSLRAAGSRNRTRNGSAEPGVEGADSSAKPEAKAGASKRRPRKTSVGALQADEAM